jgi:hypothetical protein
VGDGVLTGFRSALGSTSSLFILLASLAWLLIPFGHPVYLVTVVPCLVAGVAFAMWRHSHELPRPELALHRGGVASATETRAARPVRAIRILSVFLAFLVPSPPGYWSAGSIFLWGLVGDPHGPGEPFASVVGGATLLALYSCAIPVVLRGIADWFWPPTG